MNYYYEFPFESNYFHYQLSREYLDLRGSLQLNRPKTAKTFSVNIIKNIIKLKSANFHIGEAVVNQ